MIYRLLIYMENESIFPTIYFVFFHIFYFINKIVFFGHLKNLYWWIYSKTRSYKLHFVLWSKTLFKKFTTPPSPQKMLNGVPVFHFCPRQ